MQTIVYYANEWEKLYQYFCVFANDEPDFGYHKHLWISNEIKPYRVFRKASGMISFIYIRRKNETKSLLETCSYYHLSLRIGFFTRRSWGID